MSLLSFLLLELSLLDFEYFFVGFPPSFSMQHHVPLLINAVSYFGEWIVTAVIANSHLLVMYSELFPAVIALIYESADTCYFSTINWQQSHTHLYSYILQGKVSTHQPDVERLLFLLQILFKWRSHFCHLFLIVFGSDPALFIIWVTWRRWNLAFWFNRYHCPSLVILLDSLLVFCFCCLFYFSIGLLILFNCLFVFLSLVFVCCCMLLCFLLLQIVVIRVFSRWKLSFFCYLQKILFLVNGRWFFPQRFTQPLLLIKHVCDGNKLHVYLREWSNISCFFGKLLNKL